MNKEMKKVPTVRFKGFTDDWEQRKLGDVATFSKGAGYSKSDLQESGTPIILYGRLYTDYEPVISDVDTFVEANSGSVYSKGGEVIVPASGETAEDISIASVVEKSGVLLGGDLNIIQPNEKISSVFLALSVSNGEPHNDMARRAQGKSVVHLHNSDLAQIKLRYPSSSEQEKISTYFLNLDNFITLHQRKLDQLQTLKKYFLQNMFPTKGEKVPAIRFKGFTGDWEQRKLDDVVASFEYGLNAAAKDYDGKNKYLRITDIDDSTHEFLKENLTSPDTDISETGNYKLQEGDVLFARTGASVGKTYIYKESDGLVFYAGFLIRAKIKKDYNPEFIFQNTLTPNYDKYIRITSQRSGQPGVNAREYGEYTLMVPSLLEQRKIGKCLRNLDNLITLHQRKCDQLQSLKKFMLQNLFI